ncbi:hypothetical protein SDC9_171924 [bioreactor metagenome]|uniref:Uncharacterized protein n=1 Tax=bioreactor metagenome TaxID=1076179 RepID=A0A645GCW6_9ZZZZ
MITFFGQSLKHARTFLQRGGAEAGDGEVQRVFKHNAPLPQAGPAVGHRMIAFERRLVFGGVAFVGGLVRQIEDHHRRHSEFEAVVAQAVLGEAVAAVVRRLDRGHIIRAQGVKRPVGRLVDRHYEESRRDIFGIEKFDQIPEIDRFAPAVERHIVDRHAEIKMLVHRNSSSAVWMVSSR